LRTFGDEVLSQLLTTHLAILVALVRADVHLEGTAVVLQVSQVPVVCVRFELAFLHLVSGNLVRNFLLLQSVFFSP
jgi:hypothetical protein